MPAPLTARGFWVLSPGHGETLTRPIPPAGPDEVRVRTLASGISRGTEALVFQGRVPRSQWEIMRCPFQEGDFPGPVKYGYASVGLVEAGPADLIDRRVFCLYPHQDRYAVPATAVFPIPDSVPTGRAILAANLETAINGLWDAGPCIGDRIAVIGAGVVGGLVAALASRIPGTRVQLIDPNPNRASLAASLGADYAAPGEARGEADLVIHASGNPAGLALALRLAGQEAKVIELSWYGDAPVTLPLGEAFHSRRLSLISSQVGGVAVSRRPRWSTGRRLTLALELLADPIFDLFLDGESDFADLPETMARLAAGTGGLCHRILYPE